MKNEEKRIKKLKEQIYSIGPFLPGSISTQWNVCGNPKCRCKDPKKPKKHGPYYQLSFTAGGKSSSMFIKKENLKSVSECLKRYKKFKALNNELLLAYIQWARKQGYKKTTGE